MLSFTSEFYELSSDEQISFYQNNTYCLWDVEIYGFSKKREFMKAQPTYLLHNQMESDIYQNFILRFDCTYRFSASIN